MMNRAIARAAAAALSAGILIGHAAQAEAFECPQPVNRPEVIKETPGEIAELAPALSGGDVTAQVPTIVDAMRKHYPSARSAELANYLITAYCPGVAKTAGLSDTEKTARVQAFSKAVLGALY
jgi:hypothetical protein